MSVDLEHLCARHELAAKRRGQPDHHEVSGSLRKAHLPQWCSGSVKRASTIDGSSFLFRVSGLSKQDRERADERTRTADLLITRELFLLDEQPALHYLGLRLLYWTATKVKVGTICAYVLSNFRELEEPITI